jgi:anoctamin-10
MNDVAEIQVDKLKLIKFLRRPIPKGAADIGTWLIILDLISFLAIFSNAAIIIFTSKSTDGLALDFLVFVIVLIFFLILKYFIRYLIPDIPGKANILIKRHKFVIQKYSKTSESIDSKNYKPTITNIEVASSKKKL